MVDKGSVNSLSVMLRSETDSILNQMSWSKTGKVQVLQELREKFERQKSKLNILSVKGLEKTAFVGKSQKEKEAEKIQMVSKVQKYMQDSIGKVEAIFQESLELLKDAQLKEEELRIKIEEKEKQNRFWEQANEEIERKLGELDSEKNELKRRLREMDLEKRKAEKELTRREQDLLQRERELADKEVQIYRLNSEMRESSVNLQLMEDQKSMALQMKDLTREELERVERENLRKEENASLAISQLREQKDELCRELEEMRRSKVDLEKELRMEKERNLLKKELGRSPVTPDTSQKDSFVRLPVFSIFKQQQDKLGSVLSGDHSQRSPVKSRDTSSNQGTF